MAMDAQRVQAVFQAVLEAPDPAARAAVLEREGATDPDVCRRVQALLQAYENPASILDRPPVTALPGTIDEAPPERPGTLIGPYKLVEQIGEGGMGSVWMAQQTEPVKRLVAVKLIKAGMDSRHVIARFEAERQALALMDHANIAKVLDGGTTDAGRPYFVMDLVKGVPITRYCDENHLTPKQRLELFIPVCEAVQHAHQKGIIHRDLKPSNVLVAPYDGKPVPKVIDFGVAKAAGQSLTDKTLVTGFGAIVGTLEYMSPEQAELNNHDIDTRSDVYALGVLLYELLTGSPPFPRKESEDGGMLELLRRIREQEPTRPSTRLSTAEGLPTLAANRGTEPAKLTKVLRGELDWVVLKALEKDRNRRYDTANGLAMDVQCYLADEPVRACPPSAWYRLRKLARRNKQAFVTAAALALAALVSVVGMAVSNALIRQEQTRTQGQRDRAEKAHKLAEERADEIQKGLEGLKAANALVDSARIYWHSRRWDDASAAFTKAIRLRPDHVPAWEGRGELYASLGLWEFAAPDLVRAVEFQEPSNWTRWLGLALTRAYVGDLPGYRTVCAQMGERLHGTISHPFAMDLVRVGVSLAESPLDHERLIELAEALVAREPWNAVYLHVLGAAHFRAGQPERAAQRLRESLATDPNWTARAMNYPFLAMAYHQLSRRDEARQALDEAGQAIERWMQARYQGTLEFWPIFWWDWVACQLYYREARTMMGMAPLLDDPRQHVLRGRALAGLRWSSKAAEEYDAALRISPQDPLIRMEAHRNRGYCFTGSRQWGKAADEFTKASELQPNDSDLWRFRAVAHFAMGDTDAYRRTCAAMLQRFEKTEDGRTAGNVLLACVLRDDTFTEMSRLLPLTQLADRLWHWGIVVRGAALYRAGRYEESVHCFERAAKTFQPRAWDLCFLAMAHHRLGHADEARRCRTEAARWIDQASRHEGNDLTGTRPSWGEWHEPVVSRLLLREAETLLGSQDKRE